VIEHLTIAEVLAMHADQIERYGGAAGLRDPGQLEAALFRPQTGYHADLFAQTAALWESLSQNHPFVDGNKRTAFAATYTFPAINAWLLTATPEATYEFLLELYENQGFRFETLVAGLRLHAEPADVQ
jgi:death-on-curing protein